MPKDATISYRGRSVPPARAYEESVWGLASVAFCLLTLFSLPFSILLALQGLFGSRHLSIWTVIMLAVTVLSELAAVVTGLIGVLQKEESRAAAIVGLIFATLFFLALVLFLGPLAAVLL